MNYLTLLVLAYLAALLWFGIRGGTRERELNAFLTAGGSAGALLCAFSLVSTLIGGSATLGIDRKSTRLNSSHPPESRMPSSA